MKTAVVILNWNGVAMLRKFLPTAVRYTNSPDVQVIVADNASTDASLKVLKDEFPEVPVIVLEKNWGFADGYNKALAQIEAEYFVLLNSDVEVTENWLRPLEEYMDEHSEVAAVQPKLLKYGNKASFEYAGAAGGFVDKYGYPYCRGRIFDVVETDNGQYDKPLEVHWATGACLMIRAKDYAETGGLDARFFAHCEEIDLCWRLRIAGKKIMCLPHSKVYHVGGGTLPRGNPRKTYLNFRNNLTMLYKNLPADKLRLVMFMRLIFDYVAALQALFSGNMADVKAIFCARRDFRKWKADFKNDRNMIQGGRKLSAEKDCASLSLLWQYYVRGRKKWSLLPVVITLFMLFTSVVPVAAHEKKTLGIGTYPGRINENFAPIKTISKEKRNIALRHAAYSSSNYDYNLTAQLAVDGVVSKDTPARLETFVNGNPLPKAEREFAIDGNEYTRNTLMGADSSIKFNWIGMNVEADSIVIVYTVAYKPDANIRNFVFRASDDNKILAEEKLDEVPGTKLRYQLHSDPNKQVEQGRLPGNIVTKGYKLNTSSSLSSLKLDFSMTGAVYWSVPEIKFYNKGVPVTSALLPSSKFNSVWMSESGGNQWIYVDFGAEASIYRMMLYWVGFSPQGKIEVSDDAEQWKFVETLPAGGPTVYDLDLTAKGRYVRVSVEGSELPYMLSDIEVYGRGGLMPVNTVSDKTVHNRKSLNGGNWRICRSSEAASDYAKLSMQTSVSKNWLPATVPATVLSSYINAGVVPNPNYDDNIKHISESFFNSKFLYHRTFILSRRFLSKRVFINFDGINWKATVWINGKRIGRIDGAFMRGRFDVTETVHKGVNNLLIEIEPPAHFGGVKEKTYQATGPNGGILGMDNPTFHASVGWDWIPTVRGRETGIWNDVFITSEDAVTLADPCVKTIMEDSDTLVTMTPSVRYYNNSKVAVTGVLHAWVGNVKVKKNVVAEAGEGEFKLLPAEFSELKNRRMRLWWPNNYGEPYLHDAGFCFIDNCGDTLSVVRWKQGIRHVTYEDIDTKLKIFVNGRRVVPLGGNWGFSEVNLNYRQREYDIAVRNHRDMNFNMIRNWVGQTGDEEFYAACDKYGIMVWQDFWLANPSDGPNPSDEIMFMSNASDYVKRIRNHASIAIYCGRNEGYPPATLNNALASLVASEHEGIAYISSSADDGVSGHGPYHALMEKEYFERQTGKLHTERGMPNIMTIESIKRTFKYYNLWPQNDVWGQHDFTLTGAQRGASFNSLVENRFAVPKSVEQFSSWSQLLNYNGYRAMYESANHGRMGLLIWMSHACWPSMTWQCYDYYFEPTAAYFGAKKACEPLHIQYNASTRNIEVVNIGASRKELKADIEIFDIHGNLLQNYVSRLSSPDDSTVEVDVAENVRNNINDCMLRLTLRDSSDCMLSSNDYLLFNKMPLEYEAHVFIKSLGCELLSSGTENEATIMVENKSNVTAYMTRLKLIDGGGKPILPVWYSDNYFNLLPGEVREIKVRWALEDQHSEGYEVVFVSNMTN